MANNIDRDPIRGALDEADAVIEEFDRAEYGRDVVESTRFAVPQLEDDELRLLVADLIERGGAGVSMIPDGRVSPGARVRRTCDSPPHEDTHACVHHGDEHRPQSTTVE